MYRIEPPQTPPAQDFVAGAFETPRAPDGELAVYSPADRQRLIAKVLYGRQQIDRAVTAAREAQPAWSRLDHGGREAVLRAYQDRLRAHREAIAITIAWEVGKPLWEARAEVAAMIAKVDLCLGPGAEYTRDQIVAPLPGEIRFRPLGVLAVIGPFNMPGHLPNGQIAAGLLTGNCVVFKPSDKAPRTAAWIACCMHEAGLPPGAFNLVQGNGGMGANLSSHPDIDGVLFTGSDRIGRRIVEANLDRLSRIVALELGGKNAALALSDCDIERTARMIAFSAFVTAGQRCTATSRLIVAREVAVPLCDRIVALARRLRVGHPLQDGVFMGPVISEASAARLRAALDRATAAGFSPLLSGGPLPVPPAPGAYITPSVHRSEDPVADVPGYTDEELFAPDLAIYVVDDEDAACALEGRSKFGLSATVFTRSRDRFEHVAAQLRVGVLHWNRPGAGASGRLPFSGVRGSGNHRPAGILTGLTCTYPQAVLLDSGAPLQTIPGFSE